jgi:hypothetical protein
MCSFQFSLSSTISPNIRCFLTTSTFSVPMSTLNFNLVFPSFLGLLLWFSLVFVFSGDILKPLSLAHLVTLFAASFILVSALCYWLLSPNHLRIPCFLNFFDDIGNLYHSILDFFWVRVIFPTASRSFRFDMKFLMNGNIIPSIFQSLSFRSMPYLQQVSYALDMSRDNNAV